PAARRTCRTCRTRRTVPPHLPPPSHLSHLVHRATAPTAPIAPVAPGAPPHRTYRPHRPHRTLLLPPPFGIPAQTGGEDALDEPGVRDVDHVGGAGEVLAVGELRVGVRLEHVELAGDVEAQVDAGVAAQLEHAVDAPRDVLDVFGHLVGHVGDAGHDADLLLVLRTPLRALGRDAVSSLGQVLPAHLPDGQDFQAV